MKLEYSLLALVFGAVYGLLAHYVPDFPIGQEAAFVILLYFLGKLGVEVVGKPAARQIRSLLNGK